MLNLYIINVIHVRAKRDIHAKNLLPEDIILSSLEKLNPLISELSSVQNSRVYNTSKSTASEGVLFYEKGVVRPDLVLKDLIQIGHPNLLTKHKLQFFEKLRK